LVSVNRTSTYFTSLSLMSCRIFFAALMGR
jgi:hypothetical protein